MLSGSGLWMRWHNIEEQEIFCKLLESTSDNFFQPIDGIYFKTVISLRLAWSEIDAITLLRLCKVDEKTIRYSDRSHVLKRCLRCHNIYYVHIGLCIPRHVRYNHVTFYSSQFITYRSLGSVALDRSPSLLHDKSVSSVKLKTVWISRPLLWCVSLPRSHQRQPYLMNHNGVWWNRHTISLLCHDLVPHHGIRRMSEPPSIQGHGPLVQAHNLSLHHLHDLPNESMQLAVQSFLAWVCIWQTKFLACSHLHQNFTHHWQGLLTNNLTRKVTKQPVWDWPHPYQQRPFSFFPRANLYGV